MADFNDRQLQAIQQIQRALKAPKQAQAAGTDVGDLSPEEAAQRKADQANVKRIANTPAAGSATSTGYTATPMSAVDDNSDTHANPAQDPRNSSNPEAAGAAAKANPYMGNNQ